MDKPDQWKRIESEEIADCRVFKVRKDTSRNLETGDSATFFVSDNPDWVNVIPVTETGDVLLIEQYRHGIEDFTLEIPGGMIDENESPDEAAKRELLEETGFDSDSIIEIGRSRPNPAIQNNWVYHFAARNCKLIRKPKFDEHESIAAKFVSIEDIPKLIVEEKITHSLVLAAFCNLIVREK